MSGKICTRCEAYWHDHASDGSCVEPSEAYEAITRWEHQTLSSAAGRLKGNIAQHIRWRWSKEDAADIAKGIAAGRLYPCDECGWPPAVGSMATRYQCEDEDCGAIIYMPPEENS